jgi:tetratricopeptide (TPR) repeat protein
MTSMLAALTNMSLNNKLAAITMILSLMALSACTQTSVKTEPDTTAGEIKPTIEISDSDKEQFQSGLTALADNNDDKAESIFQDIINNKPYLAGPYCNIALIRFKDAKYQESLDLINKAIGLSENIAQAYNLRAQILIKMGKINEAKSDYLKAVNLDQNYANAHYNLALLYDIYLQDIPQAINHYEKYLSLLTQPDKVTQQWVDHLKGAIKHG